MIFYVKGKLIDATSSHAIVEACGIGYQIFIPKNLPEKLPEKGSVVCLHTVVVMRENLQTLYGFLSSIEKEIFEKMIAVSGVGPKLALNVLGGLSVEKFCHAVRNSDIPLICSVPGVGKKTAQRLIIEMRDKLKIDLLSPCPLPLDDTGNNKERAQAEDAVNALIQLGYKEAAAARAVRHSIKALPEPIDLPTLITHSLKEV